jgi:hypothetical protein
MGFGSNVFACFHAQPGRINPAAEMAPVKFSFHPSASNGITCLFNQRAFDRMASLLWQ